MTKLEALLKNSRSTIDKALDRYLPKPATEPKAIHRAMRYSVLSGGKRIRPIIVMEACRASLGTKRASKSCLKDAIVIACAVEMVHAYSLIHDDLPSMDDDDFRRGRPTSHKVFGEANAILAGDALLTLAFNIMAAHLEPKKGMAAIRELSDAIGTYGMVGGQALDIQSKDKQIGLGQQNLINRLKTARLFEASAKLGAIASGSSNKKIEAMGKFGAAMGMAFQIIDDVMDNEGYSELFNKNRVRSDAEAVTKKALDALKAFGKSADTLKEIAEYLLKRHK